MQYMIRGMLIRYVEERGRKKATLVVLRWDFVVVVARLATRL